MIFIKKILIILLVLTGCYSAFAQVGTDEYAWEQDLKKAYQLLEKSSYYNAIDYIKKVVEVKPRVPEYQLLLADTYQKARGYALAAGVYREMLIDNPEAPIKLKYPEFKYQYAQALKQSGRCEQAVNQFNQFVLEYDGLDSLLVEKAQIEIAGCQLKDNQTNVIDYELVKEPEFMNNDVNTGYTEFGPMPTYNDFLLFSSLRADEFILAETDDTKSKIYAARKKEGKWYYQEEFAGPKVNIEGMHTGHGCYSKDLKRFYFTRCPAEPNNQVKCQIYVTHMLDAEWTKPTKLEYGINEEGKESTSPYVVEIGEKEYVFFTSDKSGTLGGTDIWYTIKASNDTYSTPFNLGGRINTKWDETTPYFDNMENLLYFSSNGHPSYGGHDVFRAQLDGAAYSIPKNLGPRINTSADDMYFVLNERRDEGFLVSNREGAIAVANPTCCDDILNFLPEPPLPPPPPPPPPPVALKANGSICDFDSPDKSILTGAKVDLYGTDNTGKEQLISSQISRPEFNFTIEPNMNYRVLVTKEGYSSVSRTFTTKAIVRDSTFTYDICISRKGMLVNGIVYSDDGTDVAILPDAKVTLFELLQDGSTRKLKSITSTATGSYSLFLTADKQYRLIGEKSGYLTTSVDDISTVGVTGQKEVTRDIVMKLNKRGTTFRLNHIYYDYDKATLRSESKNELTKLVRLMKDNPTLRIEIASHTDSRGGTDYNQRLSVRRAQSVVNYLIDNDIVASTMVAKGYGELKPVAPNDNPDGSDNPQGRQLNRRTEFTIIGKVNTIAPEIATPRR